MSKLITNTIRHTGGSADNITLDNSQNVTIEGNATVDGTSTLTGNVTASGNLTVSGTTTISGYNSTSSRNSKNLAINGSMIIAQRGTSYTSDQQGYQTVDRFGIEWSGADAIIEQHQVDVTNSGHTGAWEAGFRKAWKLVNGNQSSGAGAADYAQLYHKIEAFNMAYSGWDYKDTSKNITLSFWVRSSKAQNFQCALYTQDGPDKVYTFEYTISSANTWQKITKTIPGHADLEFHTNVGLGMQIYWSLFHGTDMTTSSGNLNQWADHGGNDDWKDMAGDPNWWTTNDAEFWLTGGQLEVGDTATDFEHRSYGDALLRCQRYFYGINNVDSQFRGIGYGGGPNWANAVIYFPTTMRAAPTGSGSNLDTLYFNNGATAWSNSSLTFNTCKYSTAFGANMSGSSQGQGLSIYSTGSTLKLNFDAEL